ncbi:FAD-dependent monooxygenase [Nocardia sp. FBN12]|uniref:FAD-dependent monooxygenase n=1 Tax=Nocardia sp. FBN12 TaxID=3419766 RepID=UPI003CFD8570
MSIRRDNGGTRVAVIGGGPGGAFTARLLQLANPGWQITLYDLLPPLETFGFGVGLSFSTRHSLQQSDPETFDEIFKVSLRGHGARLYSDRGSVDLPGADRSAIARADLLQVLYRQAEKAGVRTETGGRVDAFDVDADIVVAADGVGSTTRTEHAGQFGASERIGRERFIWLGADRALPDALFASVHTEFGTFTAHAYPYRADRSTFLVETDESTWVAAGFEFTSEGLAPGQSDEIARTFLQSIFAPYLDGTRLLGNNSRWTRFRTVHCERWHHGNVVLVGDAAHTAHYSIGSGTKLAMEDSIALAAALTRHEDTATAFAEYQSMRAPAVARLQNVAYRSQLWWERFPSRLSMSPEQLLASFLTRAGNVSLSDFRNHAPGAATKALREYGTEVPPETGLDDWVLAQPLQHDGRQFTHRLASRSGAALSRVEVDIEDPHGAEADTFLARCADVARQDRTDGVELDGGMLRPQILQRLDLAERLRDEFGVLTSVRGPADHCGDLIAGLISGRTDLISLD